MVILQACFVMKKLIALTSIFLTSLIVASPIFAQQDISKVQNFITSIVQTLVTLAITLAAAFFVWGGIRYITSSGDPRHLESAKNTIVYSAIGLTVSLAALVLTNIVTQLAQTAFGH